MQFRTSLKFTEPYSSTGNDGTLVINAYGEQNIIEHFGVLIIIDCDNINTQLTMMEH